MARPTALSRALSQNFLADRAAAERFARLAVPRPGPVPLLLEVGAGNGALTAPLAARCQELRAYEIDPRLAPVLRAGSPAPRGCVSSKVISWPRVRPARPSRSPGTCRSPGPRDVVDWCLRAPALTDATLLTQLEYARKRTGKYGSWTLLTVRSWPRFEWRLLGKVGRRSFRPVPRVDAGVLRVERRETPLLDDGAWRSWRSLVELGFSGVGGSLHASLRRAHPRRRVDAAFRAARLDRGVLVGEVAPARWLRLHEVLTSSAQ